MTKKFLQEFDSISHITLMSVLQKYEKKIFEFPRWPFDLPPRLKGQFGPSGSLLFALPSSALKKDFLSYFCVHHT